MKKVVTRGMPATDGPPPGRGWVRNPTAAACGEVGVVTAAPWPTQTSTHPRTITGEWKIALWAILGASCCFT